MKRILAILLCISLMLICIPAIPVFAEGEDYEFFFGRKYTYGNPFATMELVYSEDWEHPDWSEGYQSGGYEVSTVALRDGEWDAYYYFTDSFHTNYYDNDHIKAINIRLDRDVTTAFFPQNLYADINIDLNGYTWTVTDMQSTRGCYYSNITISGGTLTFKDHVPYPIECSGGEVLLRNVVFKDCVCSGALISITSTSLVNHSLLRMDNVHFVNCSGGSCVHISGADWQDCAYINNCTFTNCSAKNGAAIYFSEYFGFHTTAKFTNCQFTNCYASVDGGAIYAGSKAMNLRFKNCTAYRCHAGDCGGFLFADHHDIIIDGAMDKERSSVSERSNIIGCYAQDSGGAFATWWSGDVVQNFNIVSCTAGAEVHNFDTVKSNGYNSWGGGVCMNGSYQKLRYCDLYDNYADWYGGAVYCGWNHSVIERCTFRNNRCNDGYGQDIYVDSDDSVDLIKLTICTSDTSDAIAGDTPRTKDVTYLKNSDTDDSCFCATIEDGDYVIYSALNREMTLDIEDGKDAVNIKGKNVHLFRNGQANVFTITWDPAKKSYIIKSKVTGLVLDVDAASWNNGANIQQWESNGTDAQRWVFEPANSDGYYYIHWLGGKYIDVDMAGYNFVQNGQNLQSWSFTGEKNQLFKLVKVSGGSVSFYWAPSYVGNGSKDDPYIISNADQWRQFALNVAAGETYEGKYFELADDISIAYVPVGYYNQRKAFKGHFDGKSHTINYIDASDNWDRGLFSYCVNAEIKNVHVTGKIRGTVTLAGVCAAAVNTTFENCISDVDIDAIGEPSAAGIVANATDCTFTNCTNNGTINCDKNFVGGIAGEVAGKSVFTGCRNNGKITAKGIDVGGILGIAKNSVTMKNCVNNAPVTAGDATAAGIVGSCQQGADIVNCINTENGVISATRYAAGMLAWVAPSSYGIHIKNCVNGGEIKAAYGDAGGIAVNHKNDNMTVENCYNATAKIPYVKPSSLEIAEGDYIIYTALDERFAVDIKNGNNAKNIPGKSAHLWQNGDANVFTITKDPAKGTYIIKSKVTGLVLDVSCSSKDNGADIQQWTSNGTDAQRWVFEPADAGCCYIRCVGGQYMDASGMVGGATPSNGVNIQSWSFTGADNQKFKLVKVNEITDGNYIIYTALNNKLALDIEGGKYATGVWGANVHLWENGEANVFTVTKDPARNAYSIKSNITGLMLDVANGSKDNGANILQWPNNDTDAQRWVFEPAGDGYYYIRCLGGQYMDVAGFNATGGGNIHSWAFTGADNQKFRLVDAGKVTNTTGAIASEASKGTYINCCYLYGNVGDKRGTVISSADCKNTLASKMNTYIMENTTSANRADWLYWTVDDGRGYALPDIINVSQFVMEGSGTADDPYLIATTDHLNDLANDLRHGIDYKGKYFKLTNSLSYSGAPLGSNGAKFAGTFDGDYHTVNVKIESGTYTAFFSELNGATVKNLTVAGTVKGSDCVGGIAGHAYGGAIIDNCHVTATVTGTAANVGGIVGMANGSTVSGCRVDGTVSGSQTTVGGIVGWLHSSGKVINCVSAGTVIGDMNVGGIAGLAQWGDVKIVNCAVLGSTAVYKGAATPTGTAFGGILGGISKEINSITILYCFSKCTIGGNQNRGFIVGNNEGGKSVICTEKNATTGKNDVITLFNMASDGVSKVVGNDDAKSTTAKATKISSMNLSKTNTTLNDLVSGKTEGNVALTAWTYDSANTMIYPKSFVCASSELQGSGTVIDPYRISIPEHLIRLSGNVCTGESYDGKYFRVTRDFIYEGPSVGAPDRPFSGIFDGDYHKLKITVSSDESTVGLFSELKGATVKNLELEGKVEGIGGVGAIAGNAYGGTVIDNCLVSATVKGSAENCGGVIGMMDSSTVSNCRAEGSVTGGTTSTGGIVGGILAGGTIVNCVSTGKITGDKAVGGILGCVLSGDPVILNCASLGSTAVPKNVNGYEHGGIVGYVGADVNSVSILACFSAVKLGGSSDCGYIVGNMAAPAEKIKAEELYYTVLTAGLSECGTGSAVTAKLTAATNEKLREAATALTKYAKAQSVPGVSMASWKVDTKTIYPKTYVGILSFNASVFSGHSSAVIVVIGAGVLAGIAAIAILYRKKKKTALVKG